MAKGLMKNQIPVPSGISETLPIQELMELFNLEKSLWDDDEKLLFFAQEHYHSAVYDMARAGVALARLKQRLPHGEFEPTLRKCGIPSQRASEMRRIADRLLELPADEARQIAALRPSKVVALARFRAEEISWAISNGHIDELADMSGAEIVVWRKEWRAARRAHHMRESEARGHLPAPNPASPREPQAAVMLREEAFELTRRMQSELALMQQAFSALPKEKGDAESEPFYHAAGAELVYGLNALAEEMDVLRQAAVERFGVTVLAPDSVPRHGAELDALRHRWIEEIANAAERRASERHRRNRWRGRPIKPSAQPGRAADVPGQDGAA